ncbi:MAG: hypothetical protein E7679_03845 [Ruminococcaceae bacterium]|nr:hypothetical protein [Oscillospiraceae bacterium]
MKEDLKHPLLISVMFFVFSIMFVAMFISSINYKHNSKTTYNELIYKEFTIESIREMQDPDGNIYYIDVVEEERNIKVNNLLTSKNVRDGISSLKKGDILYCYLKDASSHYEVVELKTENNTILSLDDYNEIYNREGIIGIIIAPIMFAIMLGIAIKAFVIYKKENKNTIDKSQFNE